MKKLAAQVVKKLDLAIRDRGYGSIAAVNRLVKRSRGWWHQRLRAGNVSVLQLLAILEFLGRHPVRFMRQAIGASDGLELDRPKGEPPEILRRALIRFNSNKDHSGTIGGDTLNTLERMRYEEPKKALTSAHAFVEYCPRSFLPQLLGIAGSAYRLLGKLDYAEHTLRSAIDMARASANHDVLGELLQRLAYVFSERNDAESAIQIAREALWSHLLIGNKLGVGKTLVDQGIWLGWVGRTREATTLHKMALEWLPEDEKHNRTAAFVEISRGCLEEGQVELALEYLKAAEAEGGTLPLVERNRVKWLRGNVLAALGELDLSAELLREVTECFSTIHLGDMALAACDLARVELQRGSLESAFGTACLLRMLVEPLKEDEIVVAAIANLLRDGQTGMTLALVQEAKSRIEGELHKPIWQCLRVSASRD